MQIHSILKVNHYFPIETQRFRRYRCELEVPLNVENVSDFFLGGGLYHFQVLFCSVIYWYC